MQKLAIIGASYLQLPIVLKARKMGLYTICFAWEEGAICKDQCDKFYAISILDKEAILDKCKAEEINGITSIASDLAVITMCYIAEKMGLVGNSVKSSYLSTNKYLQRKTLDLAKITVPKFENSLNLNLDLIGEKFNFPVIVKPVDRSGSKGIIVANTAFQIWNSIEYAKKESLCGEVIIEEFISGDEISVETISWDGNHTILAFTDKVTTGYPHFVELEHHQPSKFWNSAIHSSIVETITHSLNSLGIRYGASHAELMVSKLGTVSVIEIGARMGGDFIGSNLVQLSTGYDFLSAVINVALCNKPAIASQKLQNSGVCFYTNKTLWVAAFATSKHSGIKEWQLDLLKENTITESAHRSGYFIYAGKQKIDFKSYNSLD